MILTGEYGSPRSKACPSATVSTINPTWACPALNHAVRSEGSATNRVSHGTAVSNWCNFTYRLTDNPGAIANTSRSVLLNALCVQNTGLSLLQQVVHIVTTVLARAKPVRCYRSLSRPPPVTSGHRGWSGRCVRLTAHLHVARQLITRS